MAKLKSIRVRCAACDARSVNLLEHYGVEDEILMSNGWAWITLSRHPHLRRYLCPACIETQAESLALIGLKGDLSLGVSAERA